MGLSCCFIEGIDPPGWCRTHNRQIAECISIKLIEEIHQKIFEGTCPSCARHAAKMKDREKLAKFVMESCVTNRDSAEVWWTHNYDELQEEGKNQWRRIADAIIAYFKEE